MVTHTLPPPSLNFPRNSQSVGPPSQSWVSQSILFPLQSLERGEFLHRTGCSGTLPCPHIMGTLVVHLPWGSVGVSRSLQSEQMQGSLFSSSFDAFHPDQSQPDCFLLTWPGHEASTEAKQAGLVGEAESCRFNISSVVPPPPPRDKYCALPLI